MSSFGLAWSLAWQYFPRVLLKRSRTSHQSRHRSLLVFASLRRKHLCKARIVATESVCGVPYTYDTQLTFSAMSPPLGAEGHGEATDGEPGAVAEFAPQRERIVANSHNSDYLDDTTNQPQRIKDESDTEDEEDYEERGVRVFNPRPSLPVPSVEHRSLQNLMGKNSVYTHINTAYILATDMLNEEEIDLNPEYQRDLVWAKDRMVGLIDSIIGKWAHLAIQ